jgi:hypothetical protein
MSEARIDRIANENNTAGPIISGITTFSGQNYFVPPKGTTAERPSNCPVGSIRFNTDSAKLEYFNGLQWLEMEAFNNELGVNGALGTRGISAGGNGPGGATSNIQYFTFETLGNTSTFGALTGGFSYKYGTASTTRGVFAGGYTGSPSTGIEYVTISSTGNAISFGSLTSGRWGVAACSNGTRGVFMGGTLGPGTITAGINNIEYVTIASTGNAVDFGDLNYEPGVAKGIESSTRALCAGGYDDVTNSHTNRIDFITMSSTGNASDYGDLITASYSGGAGSSATRGLFGGGSTPTIVNSIDFVTIATTGNAQDFGDLTIGRTGTDASSSKTRCVFIGGETPIATNSMEYITIASTGNAIDFGDYSPYAIDAHGQISNGHGGL